MEFTYGDRIIWQTRDIQNNTVTVHLGIFDDYVEFKGKTYAVSTKRDMLALNQIYHAGKMRFQLGSYDLPKCDTLVVWETE